MQPLFTGYSMPKYETGALFVGMRVVGGVAPEGPAATMATAAAPLTSGMAAIASYERTGLIKRVVPVSRTKAPTHPNISALELAMAGRHGATAAMMASAALAKHPRHAISLVELHRDADVAQLQRALANDPNVASVSRVPVRYLVASAPGATAEPPATRGPASMWNLSTICWSAARALQGFTDADTINVAVLDTGVDSDHPDLSGQVAKYVWEDAAAQSESKRQDFIGHGTHVTGTIAAVINNNIGVNGICNARIHSWKIFDDIPELNERQTAYVYLADPMMYLRALHDCVDADVRVINLSIGGQEPSPAEEQAFQDIMASGKIVVAAMGNEGEIGSPRSYPAAIPGVIAVGATDEHDNVCSFSSRGPHIWLCAPGQDIWSTLPTYPGQTQWEAVVGPDGQLRPENPLARDTYYDKGLGTSSATPHVTAAVALYLSNGGQGGADAVREALKQSVDKVPGMNGADFSPDYGYGRLNLERLLQSVLRGAIA